ncbi:uncharacterized protein LOC111919580 [Lactuca sativa]|uniref:ZCF37 n=1 Tax=Lactuca sativa TaxID=4236 RepID=A0A9R1VVG9_LACSA|nr:uncharacterized protein LOC111919580 [Lactuca sativa]KAJ0212058.1 hypothetical protein LSAT_V11C400208190 [Lactuca sativa]
MAFICGSPHSQEEDDYDVLWPYPTTSPRKPTRRGLVFGGIRRSKNPTNPYADRGLDKFEALLADLAHKRQEILTQKGSEDVSMVKFVYRSPDEVKPIVVKLGGKSKQDNTSSLESTPEREHQKVDASVKGHNDGNESEEGKIVKTLFGDPKKKIMFDPWLRKLGHGWKPSYYFPLFLILILVLLMFTGRSFAILCTSLGWYLVPIIIESLDKSKQRTKITKRQYIKKARRIDKQSTA